MFKLDPWGPEAIEMCLDKSKPISLTNGCFTNLEGNCSSKSSSTNNSPNYKFRKAPPYYSGGSPSMELLKNPPSSHCSLIVKRIKDHYCPFYPLPWHRSPFKKLHSLNMERKTRTWVCMAWCWWRHMLGPEIFKTTVTLQVAWTLLAWSVICGLALRSNVLVPKKVILHGIIEKLLHVRDNESFIASKNSFFNFLLL